MPASFVDQQVQFVAEASALEEDLAGVGSSAADLQNYFSAHSAQFDTACLTAAVYSSESAAQAGAAQVASGTPFATVAAGTSASGGGALGCDVLSDLITKLPPDADLKSLATGVVSAPIDDNGTYVLLEITSRTPTAYSKAKTAVENAVQQAGATVTQKALASVERRSSVSVNPQYGVWVPVSASVLTPFTPPPSDILNASANVPAAPAVSSALGSAASGAGASGEGASGEGTRVRATRGWGRRVRVTRDRYRERRGRRVPATLVRATRVPVQRPHRRARLRPPRPAAERAAAPPPRHGGGPRARRHRPPGE